MLNSLLSRLVRVAAVCLLTVAAAGPAAAQDSLVFVGVALDRETRDADRRLAEYLYQHAGVRLAAEDLEYERVVDRLVRWQPKDGAFVARATPYVYLAAEMQGAELDVLASYVSATSGQTTYL